MVNEKHLNGYFQSIVEREEVFIRKELLKLPQKEWTDVEVYRLYRFCNVHRCYDKTFKLLHRLSDTIGGLNPGLRTVLRWTANNQLIQFLLDKTEDKEWWDLLVNANDAIEIDEDVKRLFKAILKVVDSGLFNLSTGSFIVKRYGNDFEEMCKYYEAGIKFWHEFDYPFINEGKKRSSKEAVQFFKDNAPWCADFGAYCIVSDWFYLEPEMFTDLDTWTAYGPGAYRGICKIVGTDISKTQYLSCLRQLREEWVRRAPDMFDQILVDTGLTRDRLNELCKENDYYQLEDLILNPIMLDIEHWLCEYAKYARGWAKKKYKKDN